MLDIDNEKFARTLSEQFDNVSYIQVANLSEEARLGINKKLVTTLMTSIIDKTTEMDYDLVEETKGDITKLDNFNVIESNIKFMIELENEIGERNEDIHAVKDALDNIIKYKEYWIRGYKLKVDPIKIFYNNLVVSVISASNFLISVYVDFVKDPLGTYTCHLKSNNSLGKGLPAAHLKSLKRFNEMCQDGDTIRVLESLVKNKNLTGLEIVAVSALAIGLLVTMLFLIREIVYWYYETRTSIANKLEAQASFFEMHKPQITTNQSPQKVAKRQDKLISNLRKVSDKIRVDDVTATRNSQMDISQENKTAKINDDIDTTDFF